MLQYYIRDIAVVHISIHVRIILCNIYFSNRAIYDQLLLLTFSVCLTHINFMRNTEHSYCNQAMYNDIKSECVCVLG